MIKPIFLLIFLLSTISLTANKNIPTLSKTKVVHELDGVDILTPNEEKRLEDKLVGYFDTTGTQIIIVTLDDLKGYDVGDFALRIAEKNGIGQKGQDNGIVILVKPTGDRKMTIQVGYGLEPYITDGISGQIMDNKMIPYFKNGQYYLGFDKATSAIMNRIDGKFEIPTLSEIPVWVLILGLFLFFIFVSFLLSKMKGVDWENYQSSGRNSGRDDWWNNRGGGGTWIGGGGGSSRRGGGGRSGGFGGFGGGSFGGGGASRSW